MLEVRGITDQTEIEKFLNPSLERDWGNPYDICGMEQVADAVEAAVRAGHRILIYGDYDLDGISATVVMLKSLKKSLKKFLLVFVVRKRICLMLPKES